MDTDPPSQSARRALLQGAGLPLLRALLPGLGLSAGLAVPLSGSAASFAFPRVRDKVGDPENIFFKVQFADKAPLRLAAHYWFNADTKAAGTRCPAIVEINPYRRRDGMLMPDSMMYPWYAYNGYLCFRIDLQGTGDSEGILEDEYTEEELSYCVQLIEQIAALPQCDGKIGMMGKSWSAINSLMVAARKDRPAALKAVVVCCGTDDRFADDVHYMGGAMMADNFSWPSSMWSWLPAPPDPAVVGDAWQQMWRERIRAADFWLRPWGEHQKRDAYWSGTSVRERFADVGVPVFIFSGWQDGYHNPVARALAGLSAAGRPVSAIIGPWGHKYPFDGYPGPRIDWLRYSLVHWWDRWLKDKPGDAARAWPQMPVWLGKSREPDHSSCANEEGRWVAEDAGWRKRAAEKTLYLAPGQRLQDRPSTAAAQLKSDARIVDGTALPETSSWGECGNDDLAGDMSAADRASLTFDSAPLAADLDVFGEPVAVLKLSADRSVGSIAVRLCEVSPTTGASRLVCYTFFNLCHRGGDPAHPEALEPGKDYELRIPLGLAGHTFRKGWKIRLAVSSSFFYTLWPGAQPLSVSLHAGGDASRLVLPVRPPRAEDARTAALLPSAGDSPFIETEDYLPILMQGRADRSTRTGEAVTIDGKPGLAMRKVIDAGRFQYGGPLDGLWVDLVVKEEYRVQVDDPLSMVATTSSTSIFERPKTGWRARSETTTRLWSEATADGGAVFRYEASVRTFIGVPGGDKPFEEKTVSGTLPREWV